MKTENERRAKKLKEISATIKTNHESACNAYLMVFCEKHGYDFDDAKDSWVGNGIGGIVDFGDTLFANMSDIRTDIDRNAPADEFEAWSEYSLRVYQIRCAIAELDRPPCEYMRFKNSDLYGINYTSWLSGAPRCTDARLSEMEAGIEAETERRKRFKVTSDEWEAEFNELIKTDK